MSCRLPLPGRLFLLIGLVFLLISADAVNRAQAEQHLATSSTQQDTVVVLPGVEVKENRPAFREDLSMRSGAATVVEVDQLPSRVMSTPELLSTLPGVHVRRFGGVGSFAAVSVRGSNPNQVVFYLDGVPLNQAQYGVVNAADLPLGALERVEVYRGSAPARFSDAGGGVVHLVTRQARGRQVRARLSYGDFNTRKGEAWGTWSGQRAGAFLSYQFLGTQGSFAFLDDNATSFNLNDDEMTVRLNNALEQHALTTKVDIALGATTPLIGVSSLGVTGSAGRLLLALDLFSKSAGVPGLSAYQSSLAHFETQRGVASATWESPGWLDHKLELRTQMYGVSVLERFQDPEGELGSGRQQTEDRTRSLGLRQEAWLTAGERGDRLGLVAELKREEFQPVDLLRENSAIPSSHRNTLALAAETRVVPWTERVALFGDIRYEKAADDFPAGPAYRGGLTRPASDKTNELARIHAGLLLGLPAGFSVRANASSAERLPTLFELYGNRGTVVGNRDLVSERLDSQDAGLAWEHGAAGGLAIRAEASLYRTDASDLILYVQNSQNTAVARNLSGALLKGVESALSLRVYSIDVTANWTYQYTEDRSQAPFWRGNQLPGRPPHEVFTRTQFQNRRFRLFHEFQFVSANYLDRANRREVESRQLHHLGAGVFFLRGRLGIGAEIQNLTDNRVHDVTAYPLPGRAIAVTLEGQL